MRTVGAGFLTSRRPGAIPLIATSRSINFQGISHREAQRYMEGKSVHTLFSLRAVPSVANSSAHMLSVLV